MNTNNKTPYNHNIYSANKNDNRIFMSEFDVPINSDEGFLEIFIFTERGRYAIPGAEITIYARQENSLIPIYNTISENYPKIISLPVAHPSGALIRGPQYYYTTYYVNIQADDFAPCRVNNLRLFEGITTKLDVDMFEIIPGQYPIPEKIINIPTHPRDIVNGINQ